MNKVKVIARIVFSPILFVGLMLVATYGVTLLIIDHIRLKINLIDIINK